MTNFFQHENQSFPASLNDGGRLYSCQKSQHASILEDYVTNAENVPEASVIVLDGSALINSLLPRISKTFDEYAELEVVPKVQAYSSKYNRTEIVFDVYKEKSLKPEKKGRNEVRA